MNFGSKNTVLTVANSIELATKIVSNIAGNEVGNTLNGEVLKTDDIREIVSLNTQTFFSNNMRASN